MPRPTGGPTAGTTSALGTGIAQGYATLGRIGYEGRFDYAAIGSVTNLAARLCDRAAAPWQVLVSRQVHVAVQHEPSTTSWSATCSREASAVPCGCTTSGSPTATR